MDIRSFYYRSTAVVKRSKMLFDFYVKTWFEVPMGEKVLIAVCLVLGQLVALAFLILVGGWLKVPRESRAIPPAPAERELPESGVVIHHKKVCTCKHGCKSGECDK